MSGVLFLAHDDDAGDARGMFEHVDGKRTAGDPEFGAGIALHQAAEDAGREDGVADAVGSDEENAHVRSARGANGRQAPAFPGFRVYRRTGRGSQAGRPALAGGGRRAYIWGTMKRGKTP